MNDILAQARRWIAQEAVWDSQLYAGAPTRPVANAPTTISPSPKAPLAPSAPPAPNAPSAPKAELEHLHEKFKDCVRCPLGASRIKFVFGVGNPECEVMFIGEGPGFQEDRAGEPFVGRSGQLLDKMMDAIGLSRKTNAYIANIVKCHPMTDPTTPDAHGNDRPPTPEEVETCSPILLQQIAIIRPRVIVTLGSPSTKMVLRTKDTISNLRGKRFPFPVEDFYPETNPALSISPETRDALRQTQVIPMYHPAALLRNPNLKADTWTDLKLLRSLLTKS